jgi:hypothetical protein
MVFLAVFQFVVERLQESCHQKNRDFQRLIVVFPTGAAGLAAKPWHARPSSRITFTEGKPCDLKPSNLQE